MNKKNGDNVLFKKPVSTSNLYAPKFDDVASYISSMFSDGKKKKKGNLVQELSERLKVYHDAHFCVTFSTGFWALVAAIRIKAVEGKSEVIIPSLTYRRLADVVYWAGKIPVFVDVDRKNLAISPEEVSRAVNSNTALILGVHPIVNCCDMEELLKISQENSVPLVIDAVESVHETVNNQRVGSFGVGEVFSFHASKLINGLEGGYVCTNDENFAEQLTKFSEHGQFDGRVIDSFGINGQQIDWHAAFALAGLDEIEQNVNHTKGIYYKYREMLSGIAGLRLLEFDETQQTSFKNIVVEVDDNYSLTRDQLLAELHQRNILARPYYSPPLHKKKYTYPVKVSNNMSVTNWAEKRFINLPCGALVSEDDVEKVITLLMSLNERLPL